MQRSDAAAHARRVAETQSKAAAALGGVPEELWRLRVEYAELGRLAMLSHLDVLRFLERVVRRAGLPYAISHGFSPRMRISYGAALPVGIGGLHEIFDVLLTRRVPEEKALEALSGATVFDMPMLACEYLDRRAPAASVAFPFSTYEVELSGPVKELVLPDKIRIARGGKGRKKKPDRVLDPRDFLVGEIRARGAVLRFTLEAKPTGSLRPDVLVRKMIEGRDLQILSFIRTQAAPAPPR